MFKIQGTFCASLTPLNSDFSINTIPEIVGTVIKPAYESKNIFLLKKIYNYSS